MPEVKKIFSHGWAGDKKVGSSIDVEWTAEEWMEFTNGKIKVELEIPKGQAAPIAKVIRK